MPAVEVTIHVPEPLYRQLQYRAREMARSLDQVLVEAARRVVEEPMTQPQSERERVLAVLREAGMLAPPLGPEWDKLAGGAPLVSHEELRESLKGQPPLSEDIIAMRGEL